jgi:hypothetical protein
MLVYHNNPQITLTEMLVGEIALTCPIVGHNQ